MRIAPIIATLLATACSGDETLTAYGAADRTWVLQTIDGAKFTARADLRLPKPGRIEGQAPCNRYFGSQNAVYPWFEARQIGATRMACHDLDAEQAYFQALEAMSLVEVTGETLILSTPQGREMVFTAAPAPADEADR